MSILKQVQNDSYRTSFLFHTRSIEVSDPPLSGQIHPSRIYKKKKSSSLDRTRIEENTSGERTRKLSVIPSVLSQKRTSIHNMKMGHDSKIVPHLSLLFPVQFSWNWALSRTEKDHRALRMAGARWTLHKTFYVEVFLGLWRFVVT